jgi:hypothetical protein
MKSKVETLRHYAGVAALAREAQTARTTAALTKAPQSTGYAHRIYRVDGPAHEFSDREILDFCEWTPYFGGHVERFGDYAIVKVHTD